MVAEQKVWLITGTSTGFGRCLVASVLARGDLVIATVRHLKDFSLNDVDRSRLHVIVLDVKEPEETIRHKLAAAWEVWGRIDVLVNNAGYVSKCLIEEAGLSTAQEQFDINFFGVLKVTNAVLPRMRARKSGLIVMMGSRSVWQADIPTAAYYIASKAAIHAFSETLAAEVSQFGIRVLLLVTGGFRTSQEKQIYKADTHVSDYDGFRERIIDTIDNAFVRSRNDPGKAMEALTDVVRGEGKAEGAELPHMLLLGPATFIQARTHAEKLTANASQWEEIGTDMEFDTPKVD